MWRTIFRLTHVSKSVCTSSSANAADAAGLLAANLRELKTSELLLAADTLARTRVNDPNLWSQLCDRIKPELKSTDINDVLRLVHALAKVQYKKTTFFNAVDRCFLRVHQSVEPRPLTQYFIDSNRLEYLEPNTFQAVVTSKLDVLDRFSAFDLCFILHIASKLQLRDPGILDAVSEELANDPVKYEHVCKDKKLVSMVIRSLAFLQTRNAIFDQLVHKRLPGCIYTLGPQEICNVTFSLVVAFQDETYTPEILDILKVLLDRVSGQLKELVEIEINQLCISLFHLKYKMPSFDLRYQRLLDDIIGLDLHFTPSRSKMQSKIGKLLDHLKVKHCSEERVGPYVMDYLLPQLKIAIEVNGYTHFYHQSREFNAITRLKYQIVESLGWKVLSVNYFDWKNRSRQRKLEYLSGGICTLLKA